jgi:serine/threonine-protein kinase
MKWLTSHRWLSLLLGAALLAWSFLPGSERLEHGLYSGLSALLPPAEVASRTVVITVDTPGNTPFPYTDLARLLRKIQAAGASAVGLTTILDQSQTLLDADHRERLVSRLDAAEQAAVRQQLDPDGALQQALAASSRIIIGVPATPGALASDLALAVEAPDNQLALLLPSMLPPQSRPALGRLPLPGFVDSAMPALLSHAEPRDVVAAVPLALAMEGRYQPSFELLLTAQALGVSRNALTVHPGRGVALDSAWYATDAGLRVYPRVAHDIPTFPAQAVLAGEVSRARLRGKVVLIGQLHGGPLSAPVLLPGGQSTPQLLWKAHALNALQEEAFIGVPNWALGLQRGALIGVLIYLLLLPARLRGHLGLAAGIVGAFLLLNSSLLMLLLKNTWLPLGLPVVLLLAGQLLVWLHHRIDTAYASLRAERDWARVELAANLREQGKLDKAFERLTGCANSEAVLEGLYQLGLDFERRRQFAKALATYQRIAEADARYKDIEERQARHQQIAEPVSLAATTIAHNPAATTLVVDDPKVERPVLGRYEIERELGRGAMGTVYLGRDPRIGRTVAIKTLALSEEFESTQLDEVRRRFYQEAETAGRLSHPNIVTIYDVGEEHDLAYIAMDFIQGDSLDQHIHSDDLLPLEDVFTIGVQVAQALDYAHEQKVVHRDVKPGNIIYDRDKGQLKVTDFGIACLTDNSKTRTGTVLGSPYYMSPEQIAGKKVDGRADLFSLGVTLYQLFTGRLPFEGDSLTNLMYQITNQKPKAIRKVRSELPTCVTRLINKALEKDPAKRYKSGQAMAEAIQRCAEQAGCA